MKVSTSYNDLIGKAVADISNPKAKRNSIVEIAENFKIDTTRFDVVGFDISGTKTFYVSFLAIDKQNPNDSLVRLKISNQNDFKQLFEQLNIVLLDKYRTDLMELEISESIEI